MVYCKLIRSNYKKMIDFVDFYWYSYFTIHQTIIIRKTIKNSFSLICKHSCQITLKIIDLKTNVKHHQKRTDF